MSADTKNGAIEYLEELTGPATMKGSQHWDPTEGRAPFKVMSGIGDLQNLEPPTDAPKIMPFPLDRITDQLVTSHEGLSTVKNTMLITIRSALLNKQEKALLRLNIKEIDQCLTTVRKISKDVERIVL